MDKEQSMVVTHNPKLHSDATKNDALPS